jgi:ATP-dependent DNA helicase RecG
VHSDLRNSAQFIKGVGPRRLEVLNRLGINTIEDVLYLFPRNYQDRSVIVPVAELREGMKATVRGEITSCKLRPIKFFKKLLSISATDETGAMEAVWFNMPYLADQFREGGTVFLTGRVNLRKNKFTMANPEFEVIPRFEGDEDEADEPPEPPGIIPVYPLTEGLTQHRLRRIIRAALDTYSAAVDEVIPAELLRRHNLPGVYKALRDVHFPPGMEEKDAARRRFIYEEFLLLECAMSMRRASIEKEPCPFQIRVTGEIDAHIRARIPFDLTPDQEKVIREIVADLGKSHPMNRLLQGDVGSGKTVVALYAMLAAVAVRLQVAMMAPTEILATQHYNTFLRYLDGSRVRLELVTGGLTPAKRGDVRERIASGDVDVVFGTHALIEEDVEFRSLSLLVVDEQHKFGVVQRAKLREKGRHPHCLVMTATPIPRTLMLTLFGDLDTSVIEHMPPGRLPIVTKQVAPGQIGKVFDLLRAEVAAGRQAYIVYPLIDENDELDLKAAAAMYERLQTGVFSDLHVGLLTGRMPAREKDATMRDFLARKIDILVATVVVEVGLDVPNATVMVIENAERFGLSQLHQLRGRIGRSKFQSHCLAVAAPKTDEAKARLKAFVECSDGFRLAEEDLRLRGPGEFFGTRQHGMPELKLANLVTDYDILKLAAADAKDLVGTDDRLRNPALRPLRARTLALFGKTLELVDVG